MSETAEAAELEHVVLWARVSGPSGLDTQPRRSRPPKDAATRSETTYSLGGAIRALEARLQAGGGSVEAQLSGQLVATFAGADALEAVELGLELLDEADGYELAIALALSPTWRDGGVSIGSAFDDAFFLASRAKPGEILVDGALRDRVPGTFLFARHISQGGVRAGSIDRRHPRRADCLENLAALAPPPLVAATRELAAPLLEAMRAPGATVVLEGPLGAGASELVEHARQASGVARTMALGAASGALAPLESLRHAITSGPDDAPLDADLRARVLGGELPPLEALADALARGLGNGPAWVVLNPLAAVDVASLEVVAALRARLGASLSMVARTPLEGALPAVLGRETARFTLPPLRSADARESVRAILGAGTSDDVARRVATMGGDSPLGCEQAARLLVASGDLVREDGAFVWRTTPRAGVESVGVEELARGRMDLLSADARRVLEIVSVLPRSASREVLGAVASRDGLGARAVAAAMTALADEGWLDARDEPAAQFVRRVVQTAMPPARLSELHRFAIEALESDPLHRNMVAHFALEGGLDAEAEAHARRVGELLARAGYAHASARFLGAPSIPPASSASVAPRGDRPGRSVGPPRITHAAEPGVPTAPYPALTPRAASAPPPTQETPLEDTDDAGGPDPRALRAALRARDVDAIERWVEQATLAGTDLAAIARLRAVIDLLRGDFVNAEARIARAAGDDADPKPMLAQAMTALGAGRTADAVRLALGALALSLRTSDARGRGAALHALAACYRAEGRPDDAARLAARA